MRTRIPTQPIFSWSGQPSSILAIDDWMVIVRRWGTMHIYKGPSGNKWCCTHPLYQLRVRLSAGNLKLRLPSRKLSPRYVGPFKMIKQINKVTYKPQLSANYRISSSFYVSPLKPAHPGMHPNAENQDHPQHWTQSELQHMQWSSCWTLDEEGANSNIWWTGKHTDQRKDFG